MIEFLQHQRYPIQQGHRPQIEVQVTMQQGTQCRCAVIKKVATLAQHLNHSDTISLTLRLTPHGHLLADAGDGPVVEAFARGAGHGLLRLGAGTTKVLPSDLAWWRNFSRRAVSALCHQASTNVSPPEAELAALVLTVPMMKGAEYVTADVLSHLWQEIVAAVAKEAGSDLQGFLSALNPAWNTIGRVHFNLAENRGDPDFPFAFMASYTTELAASGQARHVPLGQALHDYADDHSRLLNLLLPVSRASQLCPWLKEMVDGGEIYHPLRWTPANAARFLDSAPDLGAAGIVLRMPAGWAAARPSRPRVTASIGSETPSAVGLEGLLDFRMEVTLNGETLSDEEMSALLSSADSLVMLRGQWVEIDRDRLEREMQRFKSAEELAASNGLSFAEAMRLMSGAAIAAEDDVDEATRQWSQVTAGPWLAKTLKALRDPSGDGCPRVTLKAHLRPYQEAGVHWLHLLTGLGLGACLADDMGLGKTMQVLALLLAHKGKGPSLLVAPASLLANWDAEIDRFAPDLRAQIVHPSSMPKEQMTGLFDFTGIDLVITSYGTLLRQPVLTTTDWKFLVLDEAQAIKNPKAKQTKAVKSIKASSRIALTGTPVENHLGDLWSIFDVINPGLLGSGKQFSRYAKTLAAREHNAFGPLRELVQPYILRRMKTDKSVISDLPDKTEVKAHCMLSRKQAALYAQTVEQLAEALNATSGIERKGLVLATIMRLKQICNHPSQWLNDGGWDETDSGKWIRLREIAEVVAARQDKMLVFTQFREVTAPLHDYLAEIFGRPGLVLHGNTPVKARKSLVKAFQEDENVPFFVLSLKAGGSGLTLTAASHVVHFDRWWNPAVENQATDRAFRIGQKRNVLVHKFICAGTVEEKIDAMIEAKKSLSEELLGGSAEINLTEMNDDDLLRLVALDLAAVSKD